MSKKKSEKESGINKALEKMEKELGSETVKTDDFYRGAYTTEGGACYPSGIANGVVLPSSVEEVQKVVRIANEFKSPLIPMGGRVNCFQMLTVPSQGAILIDLAKMNRIIEIDEDNMSVTTEAGATVYQVDMALRERGFRKPVHPMGQPAAITMGAEVSKNSMGACGSGLGPVDRWSLGIKVVLGNGDILETGSARVLEDTPYFHRYKLPDLTGLFMQSEGGLGIIVETTEKICPVVAWVEAVDFEFPKEDGGKNLIKAAQELRQKQLFSDLYWTLPSAVSWMERGKQYREKYSKEEIDKITPLTPWGDSPLDKYNDYLSIIVESIVSEGEGEARKKETIAIGEKYGGKYIGSAFGELQAAIPPLSNMYGARTPFIQLEFGLRQNWYYWFHEFPYFMVPDVVRVLEESYTQCKLPLSRFWTTVYFTYYGGAVNPMVHYLNPEEAEEAVRWIEISRDQVLKKFPFIPSGIGSSIAREVLVSRMKPYCAKYMKKIKELFDPNMIMNPGKSIWPE